MKLTAIFLFAACMQVSASGYSQKITLSQTNVSLKKVFREIENQSGYHFFYKDRLLRQTGNVSIDVRSASVEDALDQCLKDQPLTYTILDKTIVIKAKERQSVMVPKSTPSDLIVAPLNIINGAVKDAQGHPLVSVSVIVKGTTKGTSTNTDGSFSIDANPGDVLEFTMVGYQKKSVTVGKGNNLSVVMEIEAAVGSEVVVVGYGTQKRSSVTASISKVQNDILDQVPSGRLETALIGRMAGVNISTLRSTPGTPPAINVRGFGSVTAGSNPLVVIDGFPGGDLGQLDMNDVESIEVLKDASSAAIYGSRGSGGVVLITTKRGKSGKPVLSLNGYYGISQPMLFNDWVMGKEYYDYVVKYQNREFARVGGDISLPIFGDSRRPVRYQVNPLINQTPLTNWEDESTQTAPIQNYNLSVRGGSENVSYYVSGTYSNEQGNIKTTFYETYSFRANLNAKINNVISLGLELNPHFSRQRVAGADGMLQINKFAPMVPPYKVNGKYLRAKDMIPDEGFAGAANPYTYLYGTKDYNNSFANLSQAFINLKLADGLSFKTSIGTNLIFNTNNYFRDGDGDLAVPLAGRVIKNQDIKLVNENVLNYNRTFNEVHEFSGLLGASYQKDNSENVTMNAVSNSFNNDIIRTLNNAIINPSNSSQSKSHWGLISYFARINYAYKDKYLLAASFRTDGSSRFGTDNKWGNFPSVSAAWRVSKEKFMQNISVINELKLRSSYGVTGNFNIGDFQYLGTVSNVNYSPDNQTVNGIAQTSIENQKLSWEKVKGYDLGIELGMFNNRLNMNFDYYNKRTEGMLYQVNVPAITGFTSSIENVGIISNKGIEVEIQTRNLTGPFKWNTSFNFSHNKNEVLDLGGVNERTIPISIGMEWILRIGEPMFSYYGYKMIGVFQDNNEIANTPHITGAAPGDPIIKDVYGDGEIDSKDRVILGNFQPKMLLGMTNQFSWKGFDLSISLQASLGSKIYNEINLFYQGVNLGSMRRPLVENQWWSAEEPGDGKTPAIGYTHLYGYITNTDYYIESGSYLNFRNLNLGYNLSNLVKTKGLKSLRVYTSISNLLLIKSKNNHDYNPEGDVTGGVTGINSTPGFNQGSEPINRTIVFGINAGF